MGFKLLLADDSITIQKVVNIIFSNEECDLTVVDNGDAALEKARQVVPDIMLVDTLMPGMGGYDVCEQVRKEPSLKDIPILLLTGAFEPFDAEKARLSGADDFISKPFESQALVDKVKTLVLLGIDRKVAAPAPPVSSPSPAAPSIPEPSQPAEDIWAVETPVDQGESLVEHVEDVAPPVENFWQFSAPAEERLVQDQLADTQIAEEITEAPLEPLEEVVWGAGVSSGESAQAEVSRGTATSAPLQEAVEVSADDDLWGVFELEPVEDEDDSQLTAYEIEDEPVISSYAEERANPETDSFLDLTNGASEESENDKAAGIDGSEPAASSSQYFFGDEQGEAKSNVGTQPAAQRLAEVAAVAVPQPENAEGDASAPPATVTMAGGAVLSEEQLASLISKISRDVIEKIAWEVVPDLAEMLIKEEIRKLKEGR